MTEIRDQLENILCVPLRRPLRPLRLTIVRENKD